LDNRGIARILNEIGDLLEIKGANPFRIRAYRTAAATIGDHPVRAADLAAADLLKLPGIGKDIAGKVREIVDTGESRHHRELIDEFPPTLLDLLRLQGVGPKTAARLYGLLRISTLDELEAAVREGRLRTLPGFGAKKEELILKALDEWRRQVGRHLLARAHESASALLSFLSEREPTGEFIAVGSLRRGCDTCGDLDILAIGGTPEVMGIFASYWRVDRVLGGGDTKSSVLLTGGLQADLRLVPEGSRGAAMQYFTGSKAHNIALRDRAIRRGLKLNEYGLYEIDTNRVVAGPTEAEIYGALGLAPIPPELRENRGEIEAAEAGRLPSLVDLADLRGDLHAHTTASDGRDDIETMARAAREFGLSYLAITDHSKALAMAGGLDERRVLEQATEVRAIGARLDGFTLLAGIECDILPDGTLDLAAECLAELDLVVGSIHSAFAQPAAQITDRLLRAIESGRMHVLGHPTGRLILRREPYGFDVERVIRAAAACGVALEINSQVDRLDLNEAHARLARELGARVVIASDAHARGGFDALRWGVLTARRAWLEPADVLNTRGAGELLAALKKT
jgi:DNA polymerase (family 10)